MTIPQVKVVDTGRQLPNEEGAQEESWWGPHLGTSDGSLFDSNKNSVGKLLITGMGCLFEEWTTCQIECRSDPLPPDKKMPERGYML